MASSRALTVWLPILAWAAVIFAFSSIPSLSSGLGVWDTVLRKGAHMLEYALLWFLWWRALGYGSKLPAVAIALAYAATDEFHQHFVEGRVGSPVDWLIDATGVALAIAAVNWRARKRAAVLEA